MVIFVLQYPSSLALLLQPPCLPIMRFLVNSESPSGGQRASASPGARRADAAGFRFKAAGGDAPLLGDPFSRHWQIRTIASPMGRILVAPNCRQASAGLPPRP
jgi:hypothetical protein